ncbi:hypothetical protein J2752_000440 [Halarchaeum rubridurum]|uniref:Uncharacterized protein n=1 Tax=Halarchaeum rubridurum TaxID=489911 RepID=A0A830FYW1_9EURY|nr:hypothetical protein [Halarchaeum rubridurum]MBP1953559.1 hypothetical protein [Halarchaeum rubridurum]GGM64388.1 hypothetical protein GCM10009017_13020 [Halarchaeum rubridurum]
MTYQAQCEECGERVDDAFLMGQFHEDEYLSHPLGDKLKEAGYELQDTITFCADCTAGFLLDDD